MALHRLSTLQQLKELRKPTSSPGFKFSRKGDGCQGVGDYSYSPSDIYIIHNLSTVNWLPSGKVLLALEGIKPSLLILLGQIQESNSAGQVNRKQQGRKWSESEYIHACLGKVSQILQPGLSFKHSITGNYFIAQNKLYCFIKIQCNNLFFFGVSKCPVYTSNQTMTLLQISVYKVS